MTTATRRAQPPKFPRIKELARGSDPRFEQRARCGTATIGVFDEKGDNEAQPAYLQRVALAASTCASCPVMAACLEFGTANRCSGFMGGVLLVDGKPQRLHRRGSRS